MTINLPKKFYASLIFTTVLLCSNVNNLLANPLNDIQITTTEGKVISLLNDDPVGLTSRPLRKTKNRWDEKYYKDFLQFRKIGTENFGQTINGYFESGDDPIRLTIYQISRAKESDDMSLRVVKTGYYNDSEIAHIKTKLEDMNNNVFIITGEAVDSKDELNSHLKYMDQQNHTIILNGFSTNWSLNKLKLNLAGKTESNQMDDFEKDADWLVSQLINPQWVVFIRADRNK